MSTRRAKNTIRVPEPLTAATPQGLDRDGKLLARAAAAEAERALLGALAVLEHAGLCGPRASQRPLPLAFLLKLAACVRIYQWEQAGLVRHLPPGLPSSAEVWDDLLHAPRTGRERLPARELAFRVFSTWLSKMAWTPPTPAADVVVSGLAPGGTDPIEELADLLFNFRHLVEQRRPDWPEED